MDIIIKQIVVTHFVLMVLERHDLMRPPRMLCFLRLKICFDFDSDSEVHLLISVLAVFIRLLNSSTFNLRKQISTAMEWHIFLVAFCIVFIINTNQSEHRSKRFLTFPRTSPTRLQVSQHNRTLEAKSSSYYF